MRARQCGAIEQGVDADEGDGGPADEFGFARGLWLGLDDGRERGDGVEERIRGDDPCTCVGDGGGEVERGEVERCDGGLRTHGAGDRRRS
jgi:hypothetical protein